MMIIIIIGISYQKIIITTSISLLINDILYEDILSFRLPKGKSKTLSGMTFFRISCQNGMFAVLLSLEKKSVILHWRQGDDQDYENE